MIFRCQNCGKEFELQLNKNRLGAQKYIYCTEPQCQQARQDEQKQLARAATRKYREKQKGEAKKYKKPEKLETRHICYTCNLPIMKYKEKGAWVEPQYTCRECGTKRRDKIMARESNGLGHTLERTDGDWLYI